METWERVNLRRERKKEKLRQKIVETALQLFYADGVEQTTMEGIAEAADIAKSTLYAYFPIKEMIIAEYLRNKLRSSVPSSVQRVLEEPDTQSRLLKFALMNGRILQDDLELWKAVVRFRLMNFYAMFNQERLQSGMRSLVLRIFQKGQEEGDVRSDLPAKQLVHGFMAQLLFHFVTEMERGGDDFFAEEKLRKIIHLYLFGASSKGGVSDEQET